MSSNQRTYTTPSNSVGNNGSHSTHTLQNPPAYWAPALPPNPAPITPDNRRKTKKVSMPLRLHPNEKRRIAIHEVMGVYSHSGPIPLQAYMAACGSWSLTMSLLLHPKRCIKPFNTAEHHDRPSHHPVFILHTDILLYIIRTCHLMSIRVR